MRCTEIKILLLLPAVLYGWRKLLEEIAGDVQDLEFGETPYGVWEAL